MFIPLLSLAVQGLLSSNTSSDSRLLSNFLIKTDLKDLGEAVLINMTLMIAISLCFTIIQFNSRSVQTQLLLYVKFLRIIHNDSAIHDSTHLTYFSELLKRKSKDKKDGINIHNFNWQNKIICSTELL
jgi:phosphotransferase system  glucose/maltose/N-acetylglucosamine-specific IIC component